MPKHGGLGSHPMVKCRGLPKDFYQALHGLLANTCQSRKRTTDSRWMPMGSTYDEKTLKRQGVQRSRVAII